ncbi:hypothetical protein L6452_36878 [Arctium lappa]|uniref:Uncharacterized protein n=1 Tax=Arctium lappa TaxID=4217 RepID=A0ACB8Y1G0_ARCLA|nr:hypothetical protein L6452_36878 [Arctium lappa]
MSRRVSFSPDVDGMPSPPPLHFTKHGGDRTTTEPMIRILTFRPPKTSSSSSGTFSAMRFLGRIRAKFAKALGFVSSSSRKVSSSSSTTSSSSSSCICTFERSRSYVETFDSHRAQAIEDCIQFLNNSSSSSSSSSTSFQRFPPPDWPEIARRRRRPKRPEYSATPPSFDRGNASTSHRRSNQGDIERGSDGMNLSMEVGKELLKGAKGLEESLRMLVNL